ncbi:MAG: ABC transporter ATP-binding protein [Actinomycetota bacterium]
MNVIETRGLRKEYRRLRGGSVLALDGLDLSVDEGGVFGFLGPNGSGKTTTIRCLLGLSRPTAGTCTILGRDPATELAKVIGSIGSLVEGPALFPNFSARRNLDLLAAMGKLPRARVDEVLELVGLADRARDQVRSYSLGMRQRLAIAAAVLKDPKILILDEPANGLDPAGIKEVRHLLRRLGGEGKTILVSSHILAEVQQTCDRVAILSRGRCVVTGPVDEVLANGGSRRIYVTVDRVGAAREALMSAGMTCSVDDGALLVEAAPEAAPHIAMLLAQEGIYPYELRPETIDLETVFLELTGGQREAAA